MLGTAERLEMKQTTLNDEQMKAVAKLGTGLCIFAYVDGKQTRMETERGLSPYVWRKGRWVKMVVPNAN